jgi:transcriptional regulator with XRE-family HTH domain
MDQVKIGKFIAELRREQRLTQAELGDKLNVTNKTVSRWENGNYLPDIETFQLLGQAFDVSIHELLSGQRLGEENFRQKADENLVAVWQQSPFSLKERQNFWKRKWRRDHRGVFFLAAAGVVAYMVAVWDSYAFLLGVLPLGLTLAYGFLNNRMMIYVEKKIYGEEKADDPGSIEQKRTS